MKGNVYLIPTTLGVSEVNMVIPKEIETVVDTLNYFIVENIRTARRYIKELLPEKNINELTFYELNKHTELNDVLNYLTIVEKGENIGIISEAGNPGIADPGSEVIKAAHKKNLKVIPLVGPSSILLALIASGMNGQNFSFNGYLPIKQPERIQKIKFLEKRSLLENQSQIFMETPYRNMKLLEDILNNCRNNTNLCIATDITLKTEFIKTKSIFDWKKQRPEINKRPTIFIIQAY